MQSKTLSKTHSRPDAPTLAGAKQNASQGPPKEVQKLPKIHSKPLPEFRASAFRKSATCLFLKENLHVEGQNHLFRDAFRSAGATVSASGPPEVTGFKGVSIFASKKFIPFLRQNAKSLAGAKQNASRN